MKNDRIDRVNKLIKQEISSFLLHKIKDPRIDLVTVTAARVTKDLRFARIFFTVLGDSDRKSEALKALKSASGFIRKSIGDRLCLKSIPRLVFIYDENFDASLKVQKLLAKVT